MKQVKVKPSPIHGPGAFATEVIQEGTRILQIDDSREVTEEDPLREEKVSMSTTATTSLAAKSS